MIGKILGHCRFPCLICALLIALSLALSTRAERVEQLAPRGYVNDFAGVLDAQVVSQLTALCQEVDQKTRAQIAVVTIRSLEGASLEDFSHRLATRWGVGYKGDNRGVLILLAVSDRKYRIEVGYGLEPILPDGKVGGFGREMIPLLRQGNYGGAVLHVTGAIAEVIARDRGVRLEVQRRPPATVPPRIPQPSRQPPPQTVTGFQPGVLALLAILAVAWLVGLVVVVARIYREFTFSGEPLQLAFTWIFILAVVAILSVLQFRSLEGLLLLVLGGPFLVGLWLLIVSLFGASVCAIKTALDWYWPPLSPVALNLAVGARQSSAPTSISWWDLWRDCFLIVWERAWEGENGGGSWGGGGGGDWGGFGGGDFGGGGASGSW